MIDAKKAAVYTDLFARYQRHGVVVEIGPQARLVAGWRLKGQHCGAADRTMAALSHEIDVVMGQPLTPDERRRLVAVLAHALHDATYAEGW